MRALIPTTKAPSLAYRFPTAHALMAHWERPWASNVKRFCMHALVRAWNEGCDVLELPQVRYARASALLLAWERLHSESALRAAQRALADVAHLSGSEVDEVW